MWSWFYPLGSNIPGTQILSTHFPYLQQLKGAIDHGEQTQIECSYFYCFPFALGWFFTFSRYLEECSSTLATTYSSGTPGQDASIVTVDQVGRVDENDNVNNGDGKTFESWVWLKHSDCWPGKWFWWWLNLHVMFLPNPTPDQDSGRDIYHYCDGDDSDDDHD